MSDQTVNMNTQPGIITIVTSDTVLAGTQSHVLNGLGRAVEFLTANMEDTDSTLFTVRTATGGTLFTSGTVAESTRFCIGSIFPLTGTVEVVATAEGTQSADRAVAYRIYFEE